MWVQAVIFSTEAFDSASGVRLGVGNHSLADAQIVVHVRTALNLVDHPAAPQLPLLLSAPYRTRRADPSRYRAVGDTRRRADVRLELRPT